MTEKIQKVLARLGLGSRREIETWISAGRIKVNHRIAQLGDRVDTHAIIQVDKKTIKLTHIVQPERQIICYHKPVGEVCTRHDPEGRPTIFKNLPRLKYQRWIGVGRLDCNTSGLLVLTTDGELANRLMHPSLQFEREYAVRVLGKVTDEQLMLLKTGVMLEDGEAHFEKVIDVGGEGANHWYHATLTEGKKREVRRLWASQNVTVSRLIRIRFGPISLPSGLKTGRYLPLDKEIENLLLKLVGLPKVEKTAAAALYKSRKTVRKKRF